MARNGNLTRNERALVGDVVADLIDCGVSVRMFAAPELVDDGEKVGGWFSEEKLSLTVCTQREDWIEIFSHEYSHFRQLREGCFKASAYIRAQERMNDVTAGRKKPTQASIKAAALVQEMEADAERRTVELLMGYNVGFNKIQYIKEANAYIFSYAVMGKHGGWLNGINPSRLPEILALMPEEFLDDYMTPPPGYTDILLSKCLTPPLPKPKPRAKSKAKPKGKKTQ